MIVLGIESSCDETAAALVTDSGEVLADVVRTQIALHAPFGGVVPEIAARDHVRAVIPVIEAALAEAKLDLNEVDAIAVTHRPGLVGALLVGLQAAKGIAWGAQKPLIGVDHLVGHLLSVFLKRPGDITDPDKPEVTFPYLGLLVSGGHTALYRVDGPLVQQIKELGATRDDAVGEAFDKVAKLLGLAYPGGPIVDKLARQGDADRVAVELPTALRGSLEFSFSGLKSAIARHVERNPPADKQAVADLCKAFQRSATHTLVIKALAAAAQENLNRVVLGGGVAANSGLRARMAKGCAARGLTLFVPPIASCTDNAAMIAYAGAQRLLAGERDTLDLAPAPRTALPRLTKKGRGARTRR